MSVDPTFFALLVVASLVAIAARRLRVPYTVALVLAGLALRAIPAAALSLDPARVRLTPEIFGLLLPVLLFEASYHLAWPRFRSNARSILLLAVPGVALSVVVGGLLTRVLEAATGTDVPLSVAFLCAAVLAATDPVSVVALFKELGVPARLAVIVEGESLLNDAIGVLAFTVCASLAGVGATSEASTVPWLVRLVLWEVGVGLAIGLAVGAGIGWVVSRVDDHLIEIMLTTVAAFGSFLAASVVHASPILATIAAGMVTASVAAGHAMTPTTRIAVEGFWEYCVFAANGFVFLLVGVEIDIERLASRWLSIVAAWVALTITRALVIVVVERALSRTHERWPRRWNAVLVWGGLRGALSMVLALSIGDALHERDLVVDLTFGFVLLSIVVQGASMTPVLRWAGLVAGPAEEARRARLRIALAALRTSLVHLDRSAALGGIDEAAHRLVRARLEGRQLQIETELASVGGEAPPSTEALARAERELRAVEETVADEAARTDELDADA